MSKVIKGVGYIVLVVTMTFIRCGGEVIIVGRKDGGEAKDLLRISCSMSR